MHLQTLTAADEELTVRLECDPVIMQHIGGPRPETDVRAAHKRRLALMEKGQAHMYTVVGNAGQVLGTIGIWKIGWMGPHTYEMGWFVLPEHQGKGIATQAGRLLIAWAAAHPDIGIIHAYPAVTNLASNAVAHKIGMKNMGEFDNEGFAGILRCNDWMIELS